MSSPLSLSVLWLFWAKECGDTSEPQGYCHQRQSLPGSPEMLIVWHSLVQPSHHTVRSPRHMERPQVGASAGRCTCGAQAPSYSSAGSRRVNERVSLQMSALSHGLLTPWSRVSYPCCVLQFLTLCIHGRNKMTVLLGHQVCSGLLFSNRLCEQCGKNVYFLSRKLGVHSQLQNWESELQPAALHAIWSTCLSSAVLEHETCVEWWRCP